MCEQISEANTELPKTMAPFACAADHGFLYDHAGKIQLILIPLKIIIPFAALVIAGISLLYNAHQIHKHYGDKQDGHAQKMRELGLRQAMSVLQTCVIIGLMTGCWQLTIVALIVISLIHLVQAGLEARQLLANSGDSKQSNVIITLKVLSHLALSVVSILSALVLGECNLIDQSKDALTAAKEAKDLPSIKTNISDMNAHYEKLDQYMQMLSMTTLIAFGASCMAGLMALGHWVSNKLTSVRQPANIAENSALMAEGGQRSDPSETVDAGQSESFPPKSGPA